MVDKENADNILGITTYYIVFVKLLQYICMITKGWRGLFKNMFVN